MAVNSTSRYAGDTILSVPTRTGTAQQVILHTESQYRSFAFTYYQWVDTDRPDLLGASFYGDDTKWWMVAQANPEILDWFSVPVGTVIRIPNG